MAYITYYVAMSLDGFVARANGDVDWLDHYDVEGEDYGYSPFCDSQDAMVMGRKTYEQVLNFGVWPYSNKRCFVCTSQTLEPDPNVTFWQQSIQEFADQVTTLKMKNVWLVGGTQLAEAFRSEGLVHEYHISVMPILLGSGIPLFADRDHNAHLVLENSMTYPNGVVQLRYKTTI
jgi:dihydrofolate reductase